MKIINFPGLESLKQHQFVFNKIFFFPKFASKVAPKVSPKPPTKAVYLVSPRKIPKAVPSNFPT